MAAAVRTATARYQGLGKAGKGSVSLGSGALSDQPYGFGSRFEDDRGTNPEELLAAAHAACYTMALGFALAEEGFSEGQLDTSAAVTLDKDGDGFRITRSALDLTAAIPGIDDAAFQAIAAKAKADCPLSKVIDAEITLNAVLSPVAVPAAS